MKRILIFSGTTEGRQLADILDASGICADVCVATGYGHEVMTEGQYRNIYTGRLTEEEMKEFMQKGDYAAIVDATHPYAVVVSSNISRRPHRQDFRIIVCGGHCSRLEMTAM